MSEERQINLYQFHTVPGRARKNYAALRKDRDRYKSAYRVMTVMTIFMLALFALASVAWRFSL